MEALLVVGMNHRTAPLEMRQRLALAPDQVREALRLTQAEQALRETLILSTCNRTEIYTLSPDPGRAEASLRELVVRLKGRDLLSPGPHRYLYRDREAVRQLFRVAAGLDSIVLGETQILGQVKEAYALACEGSTAGPVLNRLLTTALRVGKRARSETRIGEGTVSAASAAVELAGRVFSDLGGRCVLVVGAGETARLAARHFAERQPVALRIANRTVEKAAAIASELGGEALPLSRLPEALAEADVVVCATSAPGPVIGREAVRAAMLARPQEPLVLVDLAVPRDVEPEVAGLKNVFLYTIDALRTITDQNQDRRRHAVARVEAIVDEELAQFIAWIRSLEATPTLCALRECFEAIRAREVGQHVGRFSKEDAERVELLTRSLINKLLHLPTTRLKALDLCSEEGRVRLELVRELFGLAPAGGGGENGDHA